MACGMWMAACTLSTFAGVNVESCKWDEGLKGEMNEWMCSHFVETQNWVLWLSKPVESTTRDV